MLLSSDLNSLTQHLLHDSHLILISSPSCEDLETSNAQVHRRRTTALEATEQSGCAASDGTG